MDTGKVTKALAILPVNTVCHPAKKLGSDTLPVILADKEKFMLDEHPESLIDGSPTESVSLVASCGVRFGPTWAPFPTHSCRPDGLLAKSEQIEGLIAGETSSHMSACRVAKATPGVHSLSQR